MKGFVFKHPRKQKPLVTWQPPTYANYTRPMTQVPPVEDAVPVDEVAKKPESQGTQTPPILPPEEGTYTPPFNPNPYGASGGMGGTQTPPIVPYPDVSRQPPFTPATGGIKPPMGNPWEGNTGGIKPPRGTRKRRNSLM